MLVKLKDLKPNPHRDFGIDPIDPDNVQRLKESISQDGFWGGVVCRQLNGEIQIGAGHHRVKAAMKAGIETADLFVGDLDDDAMIRIYARENATQRGNSATAVAGSIASAIRYIARAIMTGDSLATIVASEHALIKTRERFVLDGIGHNLIERFLKDVPGITGYVVKTQLRTLKDSGDYHRIIREVSKEVGTKLAREAIEAVKDHKPVFDFQGVSKSFKRTSHVTVFRNSVESDSIKTILPVNKQADLAAELVRKAESMEEELTGEFIKTHTMSQAIATKTHQRKMTAEEKERLEREDIRNKFDNLQEDFASYLRGLFRAGERMLKIMGDHRDITFTIDAGTRKALDIAQSTISKLKKL
jgi:ribosomal protein S12